MAPKKATTLYAISEKMRDLLENDELDTSLEAALDGLEMDLRSKIDAICRFRRELEASESGYSEEIKRLQALKASANSKAESLKDYVGDALKRVGLNKIDTELFKLAFAKNAAPSVKLKEGAEIPRGFAKWTCEFDKSAALQVWKDGGELPPEIIVTHGDHLRIR